MRKKLILVVVVWLILVVGLGIFSIHQHSSSSNSKRPAAPKGIEQGSNDQQPTLNLQGTDDLNTYLLSEQFTAVNQALSRYIQDKISPSATMATIVAGSTVLNNDGSINFTVQVSKPATTFGVLIQRPSDSEVIFSVPAVSYQDALYPYAEGGGTE